MVVDKEALSQAVINLLNNAIKYSREEKHLRLELVRDGDAAKLSLKDKGIGVARGEQAKIFDKFYRSEESLIHDTKGSGLGLALVRHIMEAHGGRVLIDSTPGRGSTFSLVLPLERKEA
jgi:signal transduction histidine kinase